MICWFVVIFILGYKISLTHSHTYIHTYIPIYTLTETHPAFFLIDGKQHPPQKKKERKNHCAGVSSPSSLKSFFSNEKKYFDQIKQGLEGGSKKSPKHQNQVIIILSVFHVFGHRHNDFIVNHYFIILCYFYLLINVNYIIFINLIQFNLIIKKYVFVFILFYSILLFDIFILFVCLLFSLCYYLTLIIYLSFVILHLLY